MARPLMIMKEPMKAVPNFLIPALYFEPTTAPRIPPTAAAPKVMF